MIEPVENIERLRHNRVAFCALDMRDHPDAAGIVFVTRVIKTLGDGISHGKSPICQMPTGALWQFRAERAHGDDYSGQGSAQVACLARFRASHADRKRFWQWVCAKYYFPQTYSDYQ
ncbi:MAG: hypothetical protein ACK4RT_10185 [Erythrobacter sp.]